MFPGLSRILASSRNSGRAGAEFVTHRRAEIRHAILNASLTRRLRETGVRNQKQQRLCESFVDSFSPFDRMPHWEETGKCVAEIS